MIRLRQIEINVLENQEEQIIKKCSKILKIKPSDIKKYAIKKRSIDARKKPLVNYSYTIDVEVENEIKVLNKINNKDIIKTPLEKYLFEIIGTKKLTERIVIVGSGPCGLFCAYLLSKNGYKPLIIERGQDIDNRVEDVENFWKTNKLNCNSNVQFGEGGAGTFSDGKLNTMVKDPLFRQKHIFEIFVENGAPEEILYENKPHIGTNVLRTVIKNMRNKIIEYGGEFRFNTTLTNIIFENNQLKKIEVNNTEFINTNNLVLAIGHSARDTFKMLFDNKVEMTSKPFAVGLRIEHPQSMINISQYGSNDLKLPPASYKLTYNTKDKRGVYTFCMCPGGYVVNSSSEEKMLAINGMSNYQRESNNANSAIIVTVTPKDFGEGPLQGIEYQRNLEHLAYKLGNGKIPVQLYKDFKNNEKSIKFGEVEPIYKGNYNLSNLREILPSYISNSLIEGIEYFNTKIKGYSRDDAILAGIESRTSSPVKIIRDENYESNIKGIYPCGEGAGYAGGITSAAMDGLKIAEEIAKIYRS